MNRSVTSQAILRLVVAIAVAVALTNLIAFSAGVAPRLALRVAFEGSIGSGYGIGQILFRATPIALTAMAARLALTAGLFNIGVEGQLAAATLAVGAGGAWLAERGFDGASLGLVLAPVACAAGASIAAVPGVLRARFGASEVISGLVSNQLVVQGSAFLLRVWLAVPGTTRTTSLPRVALLPPLGAFVPALAGSPVTVVTVAVFLIAPAAYALLRRARISREWALLAESPEACEFAGIPVARRRLEAIVLSGAVAGLAAMPLVLGYKGYAEPGLGAGSGFAGLAAAMMGGGSAAVTLAAALWFGVVDQAGLALHALVPKDLVLVVQATTLVVAAVLGARNSEGARP